MIAALLLAQILSSTPVPLAEAPRREQAAGTRTLSDVARERKLGKKGVQGGTLSVAGAPVSQTSGVAAKPTTGEIDKDARAADARLAKAITNGAWVDRNIHYNDDIKQDARNEWDAAAEACRKTPDCKPVYRDSVQLGGHKPLRTDDENLAVYEKQINNGDAPLPARDREVGK
jgi:hypothetical protein